MLPPKSTEATEFLCPLLGGKEIGHDSLPLHKRQGNVLECCRL